MRYLEIVQPLLEMGLVVPGLNTTGDVGSGEIKRQAAKWGWTVDENGLPPVWTGLGHKTGAKDTPNKAKKDQTFFGKNGTPPNKRAPGVKK